MEEPEAKISKYNTGLAIIYRLDNLWKDANRHSRSGQYSQWDLDLDNIWRELARDLDDTEYGKKKIKFDEFTEKLVKSGKFYDSTPDGWKDLSKDEIKNRNKQYRVLTEKELFLKRLENHLGKGTAWSDESEDDFE